MRRIKCIVFGVGAVGRYAIKSLLTSGYDLAAVYSRKSFLGRDIGELSGFSEAGIVVKTTESFNVSEAFADVALFFTTSKIDDLFNEAKTCLEAGINVLTIAEEAMYPWIWAPEQARELDRIARAGGATLCGAGINDAVMVHFPSLISSYVQNVSQIEINCVGNFGRLGLETLSSLPLGEAITSSLGSEQAGGGAIHHASICAQVADALAACSLLTVKSIASRTVPIAARSDIVVDSIGVLVRAGTLAGFVEIVEATTEEGVAITVRLTGKVFELDDEEYLAVDVTGDQRIRGKVAPLQSIEATASTAISRIADLISAEPGYITTDKLRAPRFYDSRNISIQ